MDTRIQDTLDSIEHEDDVRIVYACESGSRAWGFPSADSDYDVRFIYVHPRDWYLSVDVEHRRDVIERLQAGTIAPGHGRHSPDRLDELFRRAIDTAWQ